MFSIIKTATKETLFYKLPALIGDIAIQVFLLYGTGMVREKNLALYERSGSWFLLVVSCIAAAWILGIKINERGRSSVNIANRAILNAAVTFILFNGLMAIIYEGSDPNMLQVCQFLTDSYTEEGYRVLGMFTNHPEEIPAGIPNLGCPEDAIPYVEKNGDSLKEMLCSLNPATETEYVNRLVSTCESQMVRFKYVPGMEGYPKRKMNITQLGNVNVISLHEEPLNTPLAKFIKRSADVVFSFLFLITLFPIIWLVCAIGIKLSSPGPVFFKQKRTGYEGKEFWCYKFRSMRTPPVHQCLQG